MRAQRGVALVLVMIILAVGALALTPTLQYAAGALRFLGVSRENTTVRYALDAVTQQALAMLQYDTTFKDCNNVSGTPTPDSIVDSFPNCVALWGKWTLATSGKLTPTAFNQTQVDALNGQEFTVSVEVPGALTALPDPTPTPIPGDCMYHWVTRDTDPNTPGDQTWAMVDQPIEYKIYIWNCSISPSQKRVRRVVVLFSPVFNYVSTDYASTLFTGWPPPSATDREPTDNPLGGEGGVRCTGVNLPYPGCKANDNSLLLIWPYGNDIFRDATDVQLVGGEQKVLTFKATPTDWGIFYVDVSVCSFAANAAQCDSQISGDPIKHVAPVVVGMFSIKGQGKGYAYGASAKLDGGGSGLISQNPQ